jgi:MFS family permease
METIEPNQPYIEKHLKHNFIFNALDGFSFWFGYSFYAPAIILPVFLTHFTQNPIILGFIPFISTAGYLVPQLFTSRWVEKAPIKKIFPVKYGFFLERLPIAFLVPMVYFFAIRQPTLTLVMTLLLFSWHSVGAGFTLVGWQDMIAKVIPTNRRGRFFGVTNFLGAGSGILGAAAVTWMLGEFAFPNGFTWAFAAGAVLTFLSWWFVSQTREPPDSGIKKETTFKEHFRNIPQLLVAYPNFKRYLFTSTISYISGMANGFIIVYAIQHWSMPDSQAASFTILFMVGQAIANPLLGWLADKRGHKLVLEISLVLNIVSLIMAVFAPNPAWFYGIFFFRGVNQAGNFLAGISIVMEFSEPENRPTFIGLANTIPGIAGGIAPLLGGWMASVTSYPWLFALSAVIGVLAFGLLHWLVREPRFNKTVSNQPAKAMDIDG